MAEWLAYLLLNYVKKCICLFYNYCLGTIYYILVGTWVSQFIKKKLYLFYAPGVSIVFFLPFLANGRERWVYTLYFVIPLFRLNFWISSRFCFHRVVPTTTPYPRCRHFFHFWLGEGRRARTHIVFQCFRRGIWIIIRDFFFTGFLPIP